MQGTFTPNGGECPMSVDQASPMSVEMLSAKQLASAQAEGYPMSLGTLARGVSASGQPGSHIRSMTGSDAGSPAAFSFGGKRLGLRTRTILSPAGAHHGSPDLQAMFAQHGSPPFALRALDPGETPKLFGNRATAPSGATVPAGQFSFASALANSPTSEGGLTAVLPGAEESPAAVFSDPKLLSTILQWLDPLELHQVSRLVLTCRPAAAVIASGVLPITDIDFSWRGRTAADGVESVPGIVAALQSLSAHQCLTVRRLLTTPDILACASDALDKLSECPGLAFLCLTLQGTTMDMFSAAADHWPGLPQLTSRLHALVCLDVSACLIQDHHLMAIAPHCGGLRALDLSYNPLVTADGVSALLRVCTGLEELDLSSCPAAQDTEVVRLLSSCVSLTSLFMELDCGWLESTPHLGQSRPSALKEGMVEAIVTHCTQLEVLSLAGQTLAASVPPETCAQVFSNLLSGLPQLTSLNLAGCDWATPVTAAAHLLQHPHSSLQSLELKAGVNWTQQQLSNVAKGCPALQSLTLDQGPESVTMTTTATTFPMALTVQDRPELHIQLVTASSPVASFTAPRPPGPMALPPTAPGNGAALAGVYAARGPAAAVLQRSAAYHNPVYHSPGLPWNAGAGAAAGGTSRLADVRNARDVNSGPRVPAVVGDAGKPGVATETARAGDYRSLVSFLSQAAGSMQL